MKKRFINRRNKVKAIPRFERPVTSRVAAPLIGVHYKTLEAMACRGEVPATKLGKSWQFRISRLSLWFDARLEANVVKHSPQTNKKEDET
jgi:hypothetical protein